MKLQNKVAVIAGGNSGIGLATAMEFKANGAKIVVLQLVVGRVDASPERLCRRPEPRPALEGITQERS
jgi:NAD(P)-dependent dehydrogenase (short-subunit alcohol dehydrogenase family)